MVVRKLSTAKRTERHLILWVFLLRNWLVIDVNATACSRAHNSGDSKWSCRKTCQERLHLITVMDIEVQWLLSNNVEVVCSTNFMTLANKPMMIPITFLWEYYKICIITSDYPWLSMCKQIRHCLLLHVLIQGIQKAKGKINHVFVKPHVPAGIIWIQDQGHKIVSTDEISKYLTQEISISNKNTVLRSDQKLKVSLKLTGRQLTNRLTGRHINSQTENMF